MISEGLGGAQVAVLGAGRQGRAAAFDFAAYAGASHVVLIDSHRTVLDRALDRLRDLAPEAVFSGIVADGQDQQALTRALTGCRAALCALPYRLGFNAARAALAAGCHFVDLGGNTAISQKILELHVQAARAGVVLVPDVGLAPGLGNILATAGVSEMSQPEKVLIWCGGLPQRPVGPFGYRLVFSTEGLVNEYSGDAVYLREGRRAFVPALSELTELDLPQVGRVEAFPTSGGSSTAPDSFLGRLQTFEYRTVRYAGHRDKLLPLFQLGLTSEEPVPLANGIQVRPRDLLVRLLTPLIDHPGEPDLVVLRVEVTGQDRGLVARRVYDLFDQEDPTTGFTAMERCTAFPAAVVAEMAGAGEIPVGSRPLELVVAPDLFLARLGRRPLDLRIS